MEHLLDFTITKVYEAKKGDEPIEGTGEYGAWKLYNFYTDKTGKDKFGFMWGEKKPIPTEGLKIKHMEYEKETKGQYTNLNVKKLEVDPKSDPEAIPNAKEDMASIPKSNQEPIVDRSVSMYVAYMKDVADTIIAAGRILEDTDLDAIARKIAKAGKIMMNESLNSVLIPSEEPKKTPPVQDNEEPVPSDTQNQDDRELKAILKGFAKENNEEYFKILGLHGASNAEEVIGFESAAQQSLLRDLEKAFKMPF